MGDMNNMNKKNFENELKNAILKGPRFSGLGETMTESRGRED